MQEIEALIRKATNTVSLANERESERKKSMRLNKNLQGVEPSNATPKVEHTKAGFLPEAPTQFKEQHLQTADPSTGAYRLE